MSIKFNGYDTNCVTMKLIEGNTVEKGALVTVNDLGYAIEVNDNEVFFGFVTDVNGEYASVQTKGYFEIDAGEGELLKAGAHYLLASGNAVVKDTQKTETNYVRTIIKVDNINRKYGIIL